MTLLGIAGLFFISLMLGVATIVGARRYNVGADSTPGVQRFHSHWVPRLGGVPIFIALALWITLAVDEIQPNIAYSLAWVACLLPAFAAGLLEDITHKVGSWPRLATTMFGAALAWWLIDVQVLRLGLPLLDGWLAALPLLSLAVTMLFVGGAAHAVNIIDGYNGLAASYVLTVLFAVLIAAGRVGDIQLVYMAVGAIAATLGFLVLNFPRGRLFLGDSGAYLLGTLIAFLLTVLVARHPQVSPMFAAVLLVYPVWELLFSSYRRRILRGAPAMQPDASHLHTLVYKRLIRSHGVKATGRRKILMNSATTLYMLTLCVGTAAAALTFWTSTLALLTAFALFIVGYLAIYFSLVRFKAQRQLSMRPVWSKSQIKVPAAARRASQILLRPRHPEHQPATSPSAAPQVTRSQES